MVELLACSYSVSHAVLLMRKGHLVLCLLGVLGTRGLILVQEVVSGIAREPLRELGKLLSEAVDRLLVHVGLSNEFGERG